MKSFQTFMTLFLLWNIKDIFRNVDNQADSVMGEKIQCKSVGTETVCRFSKNLSCFTELRKSWRCVNDDRIVIFGLSNSWMFHIQRVQIWFVFILK